MAEDANPEGTSHVPEDLAARAREIMARASGLMADAEEAARTGAALGDIERRLAELEEEQRRLDQEFVTVGASPEEQVSSDRERGPAGSRWQGVGSWAGSLAESILR